MIVAAAGRRVDAPGAPTPRFPPSAEDIVRVCIASFLRAHNPRAVVSAAACGADILALEAAENLGIRRRIVLPQGIQRFRAGSVADRPGNWTRRFDVACRAARASGDLVVKRTTGDPHRDYERGNRLILDEAGALACSAAQQLGSDVAITALIIWDGVSRGPDDLTAAFMREAKHRGMRVAEVLTRHDERH